MTKQQLKLLLKQLENPTLKAIDLSLGRIQRFLAAHENPQDKIANIIHIAGTNGKGSTLAFLAAIIAEHGYSYNKYISPHLVDFNERIELAGEYISDDYVYKLLLGIYNQQGDYPLTFFEAVTAAAFLAFAQYPAQFTLLETGLGGRFDATNVITSPICTIITPISLDHQAQLGNTIDKIAFEKAGIIKPETPLIVAPQDKAAMEVISKRGKEMHSPIYRYGYEWHIEYNQNADNGNDNYLLYNKHKIKLANLALQGEHQIINAATAAMAYLVVAENNDRVNGNCSADINKSEITKIESSFAHAKWPARLQEIKQGGAHQLLAEQFENNQLENKHQTQHDFTLIVDGGHNEAAGKAIADWLEGWQAANLHSNIYIITAMRSSKNHSAFLQHIIPYANYFCATEISDEPATIPAEQLAATAQNISAGKAIIIATEANITDSLAHIANIIRNDNSSSQQSLILICGSLYLAGEVLSM